MEKVKKFIAVNNTKIIFGVILLVAIFIRIYKLEEIPHGIHVDEAGMAYDAYCLANYGTDRYLNHLPVYLINFGGGQSALYAYLASILIKIFGFSIFIIRMPAVILGIIAIILSYFMIKDKLGEKLGLTFMALIAICPWHIMASRWGLDCNLLAPMSIISLFLLTKAKTTWGYIITGISFGITLYTYALSYIIIPIFLAMSLIYMLYTKQIKFKNIIIMGIPIAILATPLILMLLVNNGYIGEIKGFITIPELWSYRGAEISFSHIIENLTFFVTMFTNDFLVYNSIPEFGTIYLFASILAIFGFTIEVDKLLKSIKNKEFKIESLILFLFISVIGCMLIIEEPNINKGNALFIPMLFFVAVTVKYIYKNYKILFWIIVVLYAISFGAFINFYFNIYPQKYEYQPFFESDLIDAVQYVNQNEELSDKNVYINTSSSQPYIYTLINDRISPYEFNESLHKQSGDGLSYGKYYFANTYINDDAVYVVKDNDDLIRTLEENDFIIENINSYIVAYK